MAWKWTFKFRAPPSLWITKIPPVFDLPYPFSRSLFWINWLTVLWKMFTKILSNGRSRAQRKRRGIGKDKTHCRAGATGNISWTILISASFIRRPQHDGQNPRRLHDSASNFSCPQSEHLSLANPFSNRPQSRKALNSSSTYAGKFLSLADNSFRNAGKFSSISS